jgi:hypothetical protein
MVCHFAVRPRQYGFSNQSSPQSKHFPDRHDSFYLKVHISEVDCKLTCDSHHLANMVSDERMDKICVPMLDQVAYKPRRLRVATIGAGFSGLIFAHKLQHECPDMQESIEHVMFEASNDVGGTWARNTYPGVQCDVPAHIYVSASPLTPSKT